jgi:hypothetical protein
MVVSSSRCVVVFQTAASSVEVRIGLSEARLAEEDSGATVFQAEVRDVGVLVSFVWLPELTADELSYGSSKAIAWPGDSF